MQIRNDFNRLLLLGVLVVCGTLVFGAGCEKDQARPSAPDSDSDADADGDTDADTDSDADGDSDSDSDSDSDPGQVCGDGKLDRKTEACDDGNTNDGDGCSGDCSEVADGYSCHPPGDACRLIVLCGDGKRFLPELCDDGNVDDGDGCSKLCKVEIGWKCDGEDKGMSSCEHTTCGDNIQEGAESCDDGNLIPFDGCNPQCQKEPDCANGPCVSECGDGLVLGEECDDGNAISGDGCSATCERETGFTCANEGCEDGGTCDRLVTPVIYRDFSYTHEDFSNPPCSTIVPGMVADELGPDWTPVYAGVEYGCARQLSTWYSAPPTKVGEIVLYPDGNGAYVNRYGPNGEPWLGYPPDPNSTMGEPLPAAWMGNTVADCEALGCVPCVHDTNVPPQGCEPPTYEYDGNPLFFPLDDLVDIEPCVYSATYSANWEVETECAKVPAQYGMVGWPWESKLDPEAHTHNFYFTSEVTYWFKYDPLTPATLNFTGDDDVWVFVNGQLAVDLGGVHVPESGSVTIDAVNNFGMVDGNVYRVNVFHAERKVEGSSFKLTMGGFNTARSECVPRCGDGEVSLGEQCDDGVNDGGYGECGEGCVWGAYCGDGIVQEPDEECDPGLDPNCPNNCYIVIAE